jgi:ribosome biogenesis protein Tsr3
MTDLDGLLVLLLVFLTLYVCSAAHALFKEKPVADGDSDCRRKHFLPFSVKELCCSLEEECDWTLHKLAEKLNLIFLVQFSLLKKSLMDDCECFNPDSGIACNLPQSKLDMLQRRFVSNLAVVLSKANFETLSKADSKRAAWKSFSGESPVEPEWLKLEPLFEPYLNNHQRLDASAPSFVSRLWMFHRGNGRAFQRGFFLEKKLSLLLSQLAHNAFSSRICEKKERIAKLKRSGTRSHWDRNQVIENDELPGLETIVASLGWRSLFRQSTIQDRTFSDVVTCFKRKNSKEIVVQLFRNVAKLDLNMLYPCNKAILGTADKVYMSISCIVCVLCSFRAVFFGAGLFCMLFVLFLVVHYVRLHAYEMQSVLFCSEKLSCVNQGALNFLVQQVVEQEVKEALLGFVVLLWLKPRRRTAQALSAAIQSVLDRMSRKYGKVEVDFETEDALSKLFTLKLVCKSADGLLESKTMDDGMDELDCQLRQLMFKVK